MVSSPAPKLEDICTLPVFLPCCPGFIFIKSHRNVILRRHSDLYSTTSEGCFLALHCTSADFESVACFLTVGSFVVLYICGSSWYQSLILHRIHPDCGFCHLQRFFIVIMPVFLRMFQCDMVNTIFF